MSEDKAAAATDSPPIPKYGWSEFLTSVPPGSVAAIPDMLAKSGIDPMPLSTPDLQFHCSSDKCRGERIFSAINVPRAAAGKVSNVFLTYGCRNCTEEERTFALLIHPRDNYSVDGLVVKIGEWPPFGPPTPARVISIVGPDRDLFLRGRRAENQGLGLGAFAYYRRVVEEQRTRLLGEIVRVAKRAGAKQATVDLLEAAAKETQFSKALEMTKGAIPEALLIDGHNPLFLLHRALSVGLHDGTDEECLSRARAIRVVLTELADRMGQLLKDKTELKDAISNLLAAPKESFTPSPTGE